MIEIPPKFAGRAPVSLTQKHKGARRDLGLSHSWPGATGLAEDVRYYGAWMREEAQKRIGHLYPLAEVTAEMAKERPDLEPLVGQKLTVIAWLWARTVKSPNPAFSHCKCATGLDVHTLQQRGPRCLCSAGGGRRPLQIHCKDGDTTSGGGKWYQGPRARRELPLSRF